MSGAFASAASIGATTLTVNDTTEFDSSGTILVMTYNTSTQAWAIQTLTYTGKTSTTFTGIPASSTGSITAVIPAGSWVSQHFFTGISRRVLTSVADASNVFVGSDHDGVRISNYRARVPVILPGSNVHAGQRRLADHRRHIEW